ncbi:S8 family serine peptidase [Kitasatospora sp. NPDC057965]|uniref:S8 family serine peptidase n=1 Tax=Kitasatospora sp. NPDC057965 TaxID=3346291 RepID=UPI0036D9AF8C
MRRTIAGARRRVLAISFLAAGLVVGPIAVPAVADGPMREDQWHLDVMRASEMWKITKGQGVTVAVIDSGFKLDHPDLAGQFLPGKDFSDSPGGVGSYAEGHGTQMAGLIAGTGKADGGKGAYGLAPGVKILPLKIANGSEKPMVATEFLGQIGQAVDYAADQGARVINVSQGIAAFRASDSDVAKLNASLARARAKGSLVVSSVGNSAQSGNQVEYPGALPNVVGVGAADRNGTVTAESQRGPQVTLVAPGVDMIESCTGTTGYCKSHGTSDSAALVSASAALVCAVHPDWTANQVLRVLINTAGKPVDGSVRTDDAGYGAVRPRVALTDPGDPGPADVSPVPVTEASSSASPAATVASSAPSEPTASGASPSAAPVGGAPTAGPDAVERSGSGSVVPVVVAVVAGLAVVLAVVVVVARRRAAGARQGVVGAVPPPPVYGPPEPPGDNPYAR